MLKHLLIWYNSKQRNPIHHVFSMGCVNKLANTFTNLSRIPCLYAWVWLEPQIEVWLGPRLKSGEWQYKKAFPGLSVGSWAVHLMWDKADFPRWWYGNLLYCIKGPIPLTHEKYRVSSDRHACTGRYHDLEGPQFWLALGAWNSQTMTTWATRPMSQKQTLDGTDKIKLTWVKTKRYLVWLSNCSYYGIMFEYFR